MIFFINITKDIGKDDSINDSDDTLGCIMKHTEHVSIQNIMSSLPTNREHKDFSFSPANADTIRKYLDNLNAKKATGHDLLPSKILKVASSIICYPICNLINKCIQTGKFPSAMKWADVCPVYKKGNNMDVANYRPVSILPSVSKMFEKEIIGQLSCHFENHFSPYVSGFRNKHSWETVLIRMVEHIKKQLNEGKVVCAVLIDLSKAFDCLPHKLLISKFRAYGISVSACDVITSYLRDRKNELKSGLQKRTG